MFLGRRARPALIRTTVIVVPVVLLLFLLGIAVFRAAPREVGDRAPVFELERLDGPGQISSADLQGAPYALNFWASWCIPCREEAPVLAKVAGDGAGPPAFVGVNVLDGREEAREFLREFDIRFPNGRDRGSLFRALRVTGIPETIFVDGDGRVVGRWTGAIDEATLRRLLSELRRLPPDGLLDISGRGPRVGLP